MKSFLTGNIFLMVCCAFYLAWWILAFKPVGAIKGMRSGWLLIPAVIFGIAAVALLITGIADTDAGTMLIATWKIAGIGVILYCLLLAGTWILMKRPVTTELFLIVGWATLAIAEVNALYARNVYGRGAALGWIAAIVILAVVSLVCYLLYYQLDSVKGYYDGMLPLGIVLVVTAVMSITMM